MATRVLVQKGLVDLVEDHVIKPTYLVAVSISRLFTENHVRLSLEVQLYY